MNSLTIFGFLSVFVMLLAYTFENKNRGWVLVFSLGCLSSAIYGLLVGTFPFAIVETVWAVVALRKWWNIKK